MSDRELLIEHLLKRTLAFSTISHWDKVSIESLTEKNHFLWMVGPDLEAGSIVAIYIPKNNEDFPPEERGKISQLFSTSRRSYHPSSRRFSKSRSKNVVFLFQRVHLENGVTQDQLMNSACEYYARKWGMIGRIAKSPSKDQKRAFWRLVLDNNPGAVNDIRENLISKPEFPDEKLYRPKKPEDFKYHIALSCASQDSDIIDKLYKACKFAGIKTYYYRSEIVESYGPTKGRLFDQKGIEIFNDLRDVYQNDSLFFVPIVSKNYRKTWTERELAFYHERFIECFVERLISSYEYIIPIRLDDTPIPGLEGKIKYYYLDQIGIEGMVKIIKEKVQLIIS